MKTFLKIYLALQFISILWWLYVMICTKPKFNRGANRIHSNWKEGGFLILIYAIVVALVVAIGLSKTYLLLNFLESKS